MQFRSKVGGVFIAAGLLVLVLGGASVARAIVSGRPLMAFVLALPIALFAWIWLTTRYTLTDQDLEIRCAFTRSSIPFRTIRSLRPTRNLLSAPALSLDRIEITHDAGIALISPGNRETFIRELRAHCPQAEVQHL